MQKLVCVVPNIGCYAYILDKIIMQFYKYNFL